MTVVFWVAYRFVQIVSFVSVNSCRAGTQFMYTKKRSGPNTDPCGTPETTGRVVEEASFTTTYCSLLLREKNLERKVQ